MSDNNGTMVNERWASSKNQNITIVSINSEQTTVTTGNRDYKPSWSKTGSMLTFFRLFESGNVFETWRSKICVVNTDGSGFREITSAQYPHFNPTWTRDGSKLVIFNRYSTTGGYFNQIYLIAPDGSPGDEQLISDPTNLYFEWACSGLKDGRIFIDRIDSTSVKAFLLTPDPGKAGKYEEVVRPTDLIWHKLSVSPSETKVTYMLDNNRDIPTYNDCVICYADFDINTLTISNQTIITEYNLDNVYEYPRWSNDESIIIFDSNKSGIYQVYAYRLADGATERISSDITSEYQFPHFENTPK